MDGCPTSLRTDNDNDDSTEKKKTKTYVQDSWRHVAQIRTAEVAAVPAEIMDSWI